MTDRFKVLWVVSHLIHNDEKTTSLHASVRLRCLHIIQYLNTYAQNIEINLTSITRTIDVFHKVTAFNPDLVIIGQLYENHSNHIEILIKQGYNLALDVSENIFDDHKLNKIYRPLFKHNLHWVFPNESLQKRFIDFMKDYPAPKSTTLIPNPPEGLPSKPAMPIDDSLGRCESMPLQLVWTGREACLHSLLGFLDQPSHLHIKLVVLTDLTSDIQDRLLSFLERRKSNIKVHLLPWSFDLQRRCIMQAHASLITATPFTQQCTKSSSRIVTSFWFGTPVVAMPLPEYKSFQQYAILTEDLHKGIERLVLTPWQHLEQRIGQAQFYIQDCFGIKKIGARWKDFIETKAFIN
ncbi:MAG: hypothetical protein VX185_02435 [Pseudomonadota bacterium]|nr:hypothetical protein [Pseudomonadota bacterium]